MSSCFIIAELGVNWRDLVDADDMIREVAKAGADAVKFQAYKPEFTSVQLYDKNGECKDQLSNYHPRATELNAIALDESTIRYLYWRCQQHGIEFMCTPFYPDAVAMLDPYVKRWKIRYADKDNVALLKACANTNKLILCSNSAGNQYRDWGGQIQTLNCCSEYPPSEPINGYVLNPDKNYIGVSSHYPTTRIMHEPKIKYLEVHVRLDKYEPHYCPIDTKVSITMSELKELCERLK